MEAAGAATRKDRDPIRDALFLQRVQEARKSYAQMFGGNDLYLRMLGTHPEHRRRGYASQLLRWGTERAERDDVVLALLASPMGYPTYLARGFEELGTIPVKVEGDEEGVELVKMVFRSKQ